MQYFTILQHVPDMIQDKFTGEELPDELQNPETHPTSLRHPTYTNTFTFWTNAVLNSC